MTELIGKLLDAIPFFPYTADEIKDIIQKAISDNLPQLSDGKFGVFKGRNDTSENSFYRINDGENDPGLYLSTIEFNGETSPQTFRK